MERWGDTGLHPIIVSWSSSRLVKPRTRPARFWGNAATVRQNPGTSRSSHMQWHDLFVRWQIWHVHHNYDKMWVTVAITMQRTWDVPFVKVLMPTMTTSNVLFMKFQTLSMRDICHMCDEQWVILSSNQWRPLGRKWDEHCAVQTHQIYDNNMLSSILQQNGFGEYFISLMLKVQCCVVKRSFEQRWKLCLSLIVY